MTGKQLRINSIAKRLISQHDDLNVYNFLSFMATTNIVFKYLEQEYHGKIGLDRTKIQILDLLVVKGGKLTPSQLSWGVDRTKITITSALDNLEKQGLIKSSRVKKDRRLRMVTITEKGLDAMDRFLPLRQEIFAKAMSCFGPEEARTFQSMINRFKENIFSLSDDTELNDILRRYQDYSFINQVSHNNKTGTLE
jgi:DNA-binding MarR family transcriptional regulator